MPKIYNCSYQYCAAVHPRCSAAKSVILLDKVWSLTMTIYVGIKASISLGTRVFSCFALATPTTICIFLRKQSTWHLFGWKLQVFHVLSKDKTLSAVSILPVGLQEFNEARNSAHLLWPFHTCPGSHPQHSGLPPAFIQANSRALKNDNLLIQARGGQGWPLLLRKQCHYCWIIDPSWYARFLCYGWTHANNPDPLWYCMGDSQSTFCCMSLYLPDSYI